MIVCPETRIGDPMPSSHDPAPPTPGLLPHHAVLLTGSGISTPVASARRYYSVTTPGELERLGFAQGQCRAPALVIPIWNVAGEIAMHQIRPDQPRVIDDKPVKYETPAGARMVLDVPPLVRPSLGDPTRPLFITEGARKADAAVSRDLCCVALLGVWNWRGTNGQGGKTALADWESIALNSREVYVAFDSDAAVNPQVQAALTRLGAFLESRGARVRVLSLPPGEGGTKVGLDDYLAAGHTVDDLLALASADDPSSPSIDPGPYRTENGRICREKATKDGPVLQPLANFVATVTEELVLDDGVERSRAFLVEGQLATGESLPSIRVPASRFGAMNWVTEQWGVRAVVHAGMTTRDSLREGIQRLSPRVKRREVFTHTGWRRIDGEWVYLMAAGAVGRDSIEVDLGQDLARYRLPRNPVDPAEAMAMSLRLFDVAPLVVTVPLWAAVYRAPLASAFPLDFSLWMEGFTGSLKSTLAALAMCHFGDFDRKHLPGAWTSTANQLERRAFVLKDTIFVIDDYAPSGLDSRDMETKAARLLRSQGNLSGRARLRADLTERPALPPRGLILATGEQHPAGQSILARTLLVEVERDRIDFARLSELQQAVGRLPHAMTGYLQWLASQMDALPAGLRDSFEKTRALATAGDHLRIPETLAHLWVGLDAGLTYAEEIGACSGGDANALRARSWEALLTLGKSQGTSVEEERPTRRFLRVVLTLLTQKRAVLLDKETPGSDDGRGRDMLGWQDDDRIYLIPEAAYVAVTRFCRDAGEPFPFREARIRRDLAREALSEADPERSTRTIRVGGRTYRVLCLIRQAVETLLGEEFPSSV